jgi:methionyl-tRNA synthetase
MNSKETKYITTTLPYVNADPHIGFALEIIQADVVARYYRKKGYDVFFNTGTDEHGLKIFRKAESAGKEVQEYVDEYSAKFDVLKEALNVSYNNFIRTTDAHHKLAAQEFWKRCAENGDIEKKIYKVKYCVGCELEKTDSELENDECPLHPGQPVEHIEEENYFFKFSKYGERLLALYEEDPDFVVPSTRMAEIKAFVERGLEDFSISRLKHKMPWGVPVPGDEGHVMYVWFDALVNYVSALGWPENMDRFEQYWPPYQFAGKDNLRQQSAMFQAMLMSAGLPPSKQIFIHAFITSGGQKMSKSIGNVVNPFDVVDVYGTDALRHYLLRALSPFEDGDFTDARFKEVYNADLANGLGNLVSRVLKMGEQYFEGRVSGEHRHKAMFESESYGVKDIKWIVSHYSANYEEGIETYRFDRVLSDIWNIIAELDGHISHHKPFMLIKHDRERAEGVLWNVLYGLSEIATMIEPFLPTTSKQIKEHIGAITEPEEKVSFSVTPLERPLFPRV